LHIGGAGLARGYLNRPELTAEKFIPNPFSQEPGSRLYKTGDLARQRPDGNIEFLGRIDRQVKIRGFRVELEEIETVLSHCPGVRESAVVAREDDTGERQLAAYIVPDRKTVPAIGELRSMLRQKLPEYMIPSAVMLLDVLPLTPNGKVDRRALPPPDQGRPELVEAFVAPRSSTEKAIAEIWIEVLKLDQVGIHDDLFDLGGHSLLATQIVSRIRQTFDVDLSLRLLFEHPTVAGLAVQIAEAQAKKAVPEEIREMLGDLESLSDEEAQRLLASEAT
jgi:acyl carrier protein